VSSFNLIHNIGQGIANDMGCIYYNTGAAAGNQILNNACHDVTDASVLDSDGYGGQGYYLDNFTANAVVQNNLAYRVSSYGFAQTCGPQAANSANIVKNNIFAYARQGATFNGCVPSSGILQFSFANNIAYFDKGFVNYGCLYCFGGNCSLVQNFTKNLYCYTPGSACALNSSAFDTSNSACTVRSTHTFTGWQALGEDAGSLIGDPLFVNPTYPNDNFNLQSNSPAGSVGFVPFDETAPGLVNRGISLPPIPATFPTSPLPPSSY
jgi:hypothetical protein